MPRYPSNPSSDIPRARSVLTTILNACEMDKNPRHGIRLALSLMTRAKPVRKAPRKQTHIEQQQVDQVKRLKYSGFTMHEIANLTKLANSGRVSEIMTGKRKAHRRPPPTLRLV